MFVKGKKSATTIRKNGRERRKEKSHFNNKRRSFKKKLCVTHWGVSEL